uniref:Uncharacterized protein n=1 Tax=viral metagenome TaxID=1070528 RepID=A0A6C0HLR5_9ZZZZ
MEEGSVTVLVDAKEEYTKQLISILRPCIYQGIKSIYLDAKDIANQENSIENVLMIFQDQLSRIPKWSQEIINKEYQRIVDSSRCDYIDDLLKVVYVSHIKILTIVHSAQRNKKITLKVPSGNHFMHLCYIECAREFWKNPYLFSDRTTKYEHQKNMRDSETMISECIAETIRKQLPVRHILKEYLNETDDDVIEVKNEDTCDEDDIKNPINQKYLKRLEAMVKKELAHLANDKKLGSNNSTDIGKDIGKDKVVTENFEDSGKVASETVTPIETQKAIRDTIKGLDEDVIRRIIREEMEARLRDGTAPAPNAITPKKETVKEVVDKIIEQVEGQVEEQVQSSVNNICKPNIVEVSAIISDPNIVISSMDILTNNTDCTSNIQVISTTEKTMNDAQNDAKNDVEVMEIVKVAGGVAGVANSIVATGNTTTHCMSPLKISDVDEINLNLDELDDEVATEVATEVVAEVKDTQSHNHQTESIPNDSDELITDTLDDLEELDLKTVSLSGESDKKNSSSGNFSFFKDAVKSLF